MARTIDNWFFSASNYRQLSTDIKMKNDKIKFSFVKPEGPNAQDNKTGINFMIYISISVENCLFLSSGY